MEIDFQSESCIKRRFDQSKNLGVILRKVEGFIKKGECIMKTLIHLYRFSKVDNLENTAADVGGDFTL